MDEICAVCNIDNDETYYSQCKDCDVIYCESCEEKHNWKHYGYGFFSCQNCRNKIK